MPYGDLLFQHLRAAKRDELEDLLEVLCLDKKGYREASEADIINAISGELRSVAGNSLRNPFRKDHDLPYRRILIDVADKLAPGHGPWNWTSFKMDGAETDEQIERFIYERFQALLKEKLAKMSPEQRAELQQDVEAALRKKGLPAHIMTSATSSLAAGAITGAAAGPAVAAAIFGGFWTWLFGLSLGQLILGGLAAGGPAGIILGGLSFLVSPSYRKSVPAVLRLIHIARSREAEAALDGGAQ